MSVSIGMLSEKKWGTDLELSEENLRQQLASERMVIVRVEEPSL